MAGKRLIFQIAPSDDWSKCKGARMLESDQILIIYEWAKKLSTFTPHDIWGIIVFEFFFLETDQVGWTQEPRRLGWQKQYERTNGLKARDKTLYFSFSSKTSVKCTHA